MPWMKSVIPSRAASFQAAPSALFFRGVEVGRDCVRAALDFHRPASIVVEVHVNGGFGGGGLRGMGLKVRHEDIGLVRMAGPAPAGVRMLPGYP